MASACRGEGGGGDGGGGDGGGGEGGGGEGGGEGGGGLGGGGSGGGGDGGGELTTQEPSSEVAWLSKLPGLGEVRVRWRGFGIGPMPSYTVWA